MSIAPLSLATAEATVGPQSTPASTSAGGSTEQAGQGAAGDRSLPSTLPASLAPTTTGRVPTDPRSSELTGRIASERMLADGRSGIPDSQLADRTAPTAGATAKDLGPPVQSPATVPPTPPSLLPLPTLTAIDGSGGVTPVVLFTRPDANGVLFDRLQFSSVKQQGGTTLTARTAFNRSYAPGQLLTAQQLTLSTSTPIARTGDASLTVGARLVVAADGRVTGIPAELTARIGQSTGDNARLSVGVGTQWQPRDGEVGGNGSAPVLSVSAAFTLGDVTGSGSFTRVNDVSTSIEGTVQVGSGDGLQVGLYGAYSRPDGMAGTLLLAPTVSQDDWAVQAGVVLRDGGIDGGFVGLRLGGERPVMPSTAR